MSNIKIRATHGAVSPLIRSRPERNKALKAFVANDDGFSAYVHADVLDFIEQQSVLAGRNEAIGLLMGRICQDPRSGPYTLVMAAAEAREGEFQSSPSFVRLLPVGLTRLRGRLTEAHPDREIVGWYHTHPHYQPSFSAVDLDEQAHWEDPNQIGIVYGAINNGEPFGVYRGPEAILLRPSRADERQLSQQEAEYATELEAGPRQIVPSRARSRVLTSELATPLRTLYRKPEIARLSVIAFIFFCQTLGFVWLHRRVSVAEQRLQELAAVHRTAEQSGERGPAQSSSTFAPTPTAVSPSVSQSDDKAATTDGAELRPRAKPLTPPAKSRQESQARRSTGSRLTMRNRDRDRQSRPENRSVQSNTQRMGAKSVGTQILPKVVAPRPAPLPTPKQ